MFSLDVAGIGAMNMDHLYRVKNIVHDGEDVIEDAGAYAGGSAANTIYAMGKLGCKTAFFSVVGDDQDGRALLDDLRSVNVDTSQIKVRTGERTGTVLGLTDRMGHRSLYVAPGANNLLTFEDISSAYLNRARIVHLSSFVHDNQFSVLLQVVDALLLPKISFSPGSLYVSKGLKTLSRLLERTHILFLNQSEIERLTGVGYVKGARECLRRGCEIVVVTFGQGLAVGDRRVITSYIRDRNNEYEIEPARSISVTQPEATGAGDAFAAGFLYGYLAGKGIRECATAGDTVATFSLRRTGARAGLPSPDELSPKLTEVWSKPL